MSATTQPTDFSDLYTDLLNRMRIDTSQTATVTQAKRYINIALHDMHLGNDERLPTPWAERETVLRTKSRYNTGDVTVTQGSTTLTGSSTTWSTSNAFGELILRADSKIVLGGRTEVYRVASVASDTSATLSTPYIGSDLSGDSYDSFEDEYELASDYLRPLRLRSFDTNRTIEIIDRNQFRERYVRNRIPQKPKVCTIIERGPSGSTALRPRVVFWPAPDEPYLIPYAYITTHLAVTTAGTTSTALSSDDDEPIVPLRYRMAIIYHALYHWYRDKKDDPRSESAKSDYTDLMLRVMSEVAPADRHPRIQPRIGTYVAAAERPWSARRKGSPYDFNDAFDRFENR